MIYAPRTQPEVNESHTHEVPKNNGLSYVSHGRGFKTVALNNGKLVFLRCFKVEASVPQPEVEKANVQARVPERNSHVFNLSNCSVVFKM